MTWRPTSIPNVIALPMAMPDIKEEYCIKNLPPPVLTAAVSTILMIIICKFLARPVPGRGLAIPKDLAQAIIKTSGSSTKPILTAIMGSEEVEDARQLLYDSNIPTYEFPEETIKTYMYMYHYARNLEELYETPADLPLNMGVPKNYIKILTRNAIKEARTTLSEEDSKKILITYGIQTTMPHFAKAAEGAAHLATGIGYPVVMKIASPDISHKSDVGGVILNLGSEGAVKKAFEEMIQNAMYYLQAGSPIV